MVEYINFNDPKILNEWISKHNWKDLETYLETIPKDQFRSWEYLSQALINLYKYSNISLSLTNLNKAYELSPNETRVLNTYSNVLLKANKNKKALDMAKQSIEIDSNNPMSSLALMHAALANNKNEIAYDAAENAYLNLPDRLKSLKKQTSQMRKKLLPIWWKPLSGKKIQLVRITSKHKEFLLQLRQDTEFQHHYNLFTTNTEEKLDKDIALANKPPLDIKKIEWIIEKDGEPIGIAGLVDLNMRNNRAEIQFGIPNNKSSIYGVEAILLVLEFAFCELGLHKIVSYVYSDNPHAQSNTLHLGFKQEGLLESHIYAKKIDSRLDLYINGYLADNFFNNKKLMKMIKRVLGREVIKNTNNKLNF